MSTLGIVIAFLLLLVLLSVVISTLVTGMPPMPSNGHARKELLAQVEHLAAQEEIQTLVDLGSGWGHLVIPLAHRFPQQQVVGYEVSFFPWLVSYLLKNFLGLSNLQVYRQNFLKADLSGADVLICYLMSPAMQRLTNQLKQLETRPRWLVSHFFVLPGWEPVHKSELKDLYHSPVYVYCLKKQSQELKTHV